MRIMEGLHYGIRSAILDSCSGERDIKRDVLRSTMRTTV